MGMRKKEEIEAYSSLRLLAWLAGKIVLSPLKWADCMSAFDTSNASWGLVYTMREIKMGVTS